MASELEAAVQRHRHALTRLVLLVSQVRADVLQLVDDEGGQERVVVVSCPEVAHLGPFWLADRPSEPRSLVLSWTFPGFLSGMSLTFGLDLWPSEDYQVRTGVPLESILEDLKLTRRYQSLRLVVEWWWLSTVLRTLRADLVEVLNRHVDRFLFGAVPVTGEARMAALTRMGLAPIQFLADGKVQAKHRCPTCPEPAGRKELAALRKHLTSARHLAHECGLSWEEAKQLNRAVQFALNEGRLG